MSVKIFLGNATHLVPLQHKIAEQYLRPVGLDAPLHAPIEQQRLQRLHIEADHLARQLLQHHTQQRLVLLREGLLLQKGCAAEAMHSLRIKLQQLTHSQQRLEVVRRRRKTARRSLRVARGFEALQSLHRSVVLR